MSPSAPCGELQQGVGGGQPPPAPRETLGVKGSPRPRLGTPLPAPLPEEPLSSRAVGERQWSKLQDAQHLAESEAAKGQECLPFSAARRLLWRALGGLRHPSSTARDAATPRQWIRQISGGSVASNGGMENGGKEEEWENSWKPGVYQLCYTAGVGADEPLGRIERLLYEGKTVDVLEVVFCEGDRRLRARIAEPWGWISLLDTESGFAWAEWQRPLSHEMDAVAASIAVCSVPSSTDQEEFEENRVGQSYSVQSSASFVNHHAVLQLSRGCTPRDRAELTQSTEDRERGHDDASSSVTLSARSPRIGEQKREKEERRAKVVTVTSGGGGGRASELLHSRPSTHPEQQQPPCGPPAVVFEC